MGADKSRPLVDEFKKMTQSLSATQMLGHTQRFMDQWEVRKATFELAIEQDPTNATLYLEYATALMGLGQKELASRHIKLYWDLCGKTFMDLLGVLSALTEGECFDLGLEFCHIGRAMLKSPSLQSDDMLKIRFYIHYAHCRMAKSHDLKRVKALLNKALYLLNDYKKTRHREGRVYQMRLQLASDFFIIESYDLCMQQMKHILRYKNSQYFDNYNHKGEYEARHFGGHTYIT
eukprot:123314_1